MKKTKKTEVTDKKAAEKAPKAETPMKKIRSVGILPLGDRVLIKRADITDSEQSGIFGIIIPDTVSKEKPEQGKVVAVGEGRHDETGKIIPLSVKIGDTVIFSKYAYDEVKSGNEEYVMVKEENILAIVR